jgi:glycosyl transferase family 2
MPRIDVWAFCYNQRRLLPYFLAHYRRFARRITVCDNASTDGGREYLAGEGVEAIDDRNGGRFDDTVLAAQKNALWKASRGEADWVVVCDVDELVYVADLPRRLAWCAARGVSAVRLAGFNMVSGSLPDHAGQIYDRPEFRRGAPDPVFFDKVALFRPDWIDEIGYREGSHEAAPRGRGWLYGDDSGFALLHYKFLGGTAAFARRAADCATRLSEESRALGHSTHFLETEAEIAARIDDVWHRSRPLFLPPGEIP